MDSEATEVLPFPPRHHLAAAFVLIPSVRPMRWVSVKQSPAAQPQDGFSFHPIATLMLCVPGVTHSAQFPSLTRRLLQHHNAPGYLMQLVSGYSKSSYDQYYSITTTCCSPSCWALTIIFPLQLCTVMPSHTALSHPLYSMGIKSGSVWSPGWVIAVEQQHETSVGGLCTVCGPLECFDTQIASLVLIAVPSEGGRHIAQW